MWRVLSLIKTFAIEPDTDEHKDIHDTHAYICTYTEACNMMIYTNILMILLLKYTY